MHQTFIPYQEMKLSQIYFRKERYENKEIKFQLLLWCKTWIFLGVRPDTCHVWYI